MKYPQSVPMPRDVEDWLEGELEARGIDSVVYTRYVLSLMLQDSLDLDICDSDSDVLHYKKGVWKERHHQQQEQQQIDGSCQWNAHDHKRLAVVRCLTSATGKNCEIESLVDQLYIKLQDIRSDVNADPGKAILQPSQLFTYSDYNIAFPPLQKDLAGLELKSSKQPPSAWTRGILRASLKAIDTANPYDKSNASDYFPLTYCIPGNTLDIYGPRLYERSVNRSLERVMAGLDATLHQFWNPKDSSADKNDATTQNHTYFQHGSKPLSSAFFFGNMFEKPAIPSLPWSLGSSKIEDVATSTATFIEVAAVAPAESPKENLLTSDRTHFRPIHSDEYANQQHVYEDGTTFAISTDFEPLKFQRSESGTLFLDTGKYMEYKKCSNLDENCDDDFVPKFRVQQSNEKFCQTEEVDLMSPPTDETLSVGSLELDGEDFYFPGDDDLFVDSCSDDQPDGGEVAGIVTGCLNVRWKEVTKSPSLDQEPIWGAEDEAMVDELVDSPEWKLCSDTDDGMDDVTDGVEPSSSAFWPQWSDSIWNPQISTQACGGCCGALVSDDDKLPNQILSRDELQDIWKQPVCHGCSESSKIDSYEVEEEAEQATEDEEEKLVVVDEDVWKWPKLGETLSAYLRESRAQDVDLLHVWGPSFHSSIESMNSDCLRELWASASNDMMQQTWNTQVPHRSQEEQIRNKCTYDLMKNELCEDGNQLLSDLSGLRLCQIDDTDETESSDLHDEEQDTFPTHPPSPVSETGPNVVSLWATWNIIAIGEDKATFDERTAHATAVVQNDRKRRHSSSQRMCELYMEGECRRAHCRFRHYTTSPLIHESACVSAHPFRYGNDMNRAFTV